MWVELLLALLVEGFREVQEWWQTRVPWRIGAAPSGQPANESEVAVNAPARDRGSKVEDCLEAVLDRHARRLLGGRDMDVRPRPSRRRSPGSSGCGRDLRGSITKVFTATVLADMQPTAVAVLSNCSRSVDAIGFRILEAINQP